MSRYDFVSDPELRRQLNAAADAETQFRHESMQPKNDKLTQRIIEDTVYTRDDREKTEIIQELQLQTIEKHMHLLEARVAAAGIDPTGPLDEYKTAIQQVVASLGVVVPTTIPPLTTMLQEISEGKDYSVSIATAMAAVTATLNHLDRKHVDDYDKIRELQAARVREIVASNQLLADITEIAKNAQLYPSMLSKIDDLKALQDKLRDVEQKFVMELAGDPNTVILEAQSVLKLLADKLNGTMQDNQTLAEERKQLNEEIARLNQTVRNQKRNIGDTDRLRRHAVDLEKRLEEIKTDHEKVERKQEARIAQLREDVKRAEAAKTQTEQSMEEAKIRSEKKRAEIRASLDESTAARVKNANYFMEQQFARLVNDFAQLHLRHNPTVSWMGGGALIKRMNEYFYTFRTSPGSDLVKLNKRQLIERKVLITLLAGKLHPEYVKDDSIKKIVEDSIAAGWPKLDRSVTDAKDGELIKSIDENVHFGPILKQMGNGENELKIECQECPSPLVGFVPFVGGAIGGGGLALWQAILIVIVLLALLVWVAYRYRSRHQKHSKVPETWENR